MLQFYFLSILLNIIVGLILVYGEDFIKKESSSDSLVAQDKETFDKNSDAKADSEGDDELDLDSNESDKKSSSKNNFLTLGTFFDDATFRLVVAILSALVGVMKLLSTIQNDVPIIGDLIPSVAGIAGAFALLIEYYSRKSDVGFSLPSFVTTIFVGGRKYLGVLCILAGALHFIFPRVLFL